MSAGSVAGAAGREDRAWGLNRNSRCGTLQYLIGGSRSCRCTWICIGVLDTNVLVDGACRHESSLAYELLFGVLEERFPVILTEPIVCEHPAVRARYS